MNESQREKTRREPPVVDIRNGAARWGGPSWRAFLWAALKAWPKRLWDHDRAALLTLGIVFLVLWLLEAVVFVW